jgi:hypothetical protein
VVDLSQCSFADPGAFLEFDSGSGGGGGSVTVSTDIIKPQGNAGPRVEFPLGVSVSPPDPNRPAVNLPNNIFVVPNAPTTEQQLILNIDPIPIANTPTSIYFSDSEGATTEEDTFLISGPLIDKANAEGIKGFSARVTGLTEQSFLNPVELPLNLIVSVPTTTAALSFYENNNLLLDGLLISGVLRLSYRANFPSSETVEWINYEINITLPASIKLNSDKLPELPIVSYSSNLKIQYNTPPGETNSTAFVSDSWDLRDYEVVPDTLNFELPEQLNKIYSGNDNLAINLNTGTITALSTSNDLSMFRSSQPTLVFSFMAKPIAPFVGESSLVNVSTELSLADFASSSEDDLLFSTETNTAGEISNINNSAINTSIKIPSSLLEIESSLYKNSNTPINETVINLRKKSNYFTSVKKLNPIQEANKRVFTFYTDGITSDSFTYIKDKTLTDELLVPCTSKSEGVFSREVDESVRNILTINTGDSEFNNYAYNAVTSNKIFSSLKDSVQAFLNSNKNISGGSLNSLFSNAIQRSLISDEQSYFTERDIIDLSSEVFSTTELEKSRDFGLNFSNAMSYILEKAQSIDPNKYNIKKKNRLLNWKSLAEDLNKRIIYKTAAGEETPIYIPNSELITVTDSDGVVHSLEMQDGDYFNAVCLDRDNRLTVFTDIEKARVLNSENSAQAAELVGEDLVFVLDTTSVTTDLVEYNVDTTGNRQEYYFLHLDKSSVKDLPNDTNSGDTLFTRKTQATYTYTTTGIDSIVKHKAFPYQVVYLRHDDMFFNHLEKSKKATLTHKDFVLDNFVNTPSNDFLVRQLPQHMLIIPSDKTNKVVTHERSFLEAFNKRRLYLRFSPFLTELQDKTDKPLYLKTELIPKSDSVNFDTDIKDNVIYAEDLKYVFDTEAVEAIDQYRTGAEEMPRKILPTSTALKKITEIKNAYNLTSRDSIAVYDLYSRLQPKDFASLLLDQTDTFLFSSRLIQNQITEDSDINTEYFIKIKQASNINGTTPALLDQTTIPSVSGKKVEGSPAGEAAVPVPEDRGGGFIPT